MLSTNRTQMLEIARLLNSALLLMVLALVLTNVATAWGLVWSMTHKSRTVVPPTVTQAFSVSDQSVDASYLQQMAEYFALLKLNITPKSVERNYGRLLDYVSSEDYHRFQPELLREARTIQEQKISASFSITGVSVSVTNLQVRLTGQLKKYVGSRALTPESVVYLVQMAYPDGTLALTDLRQLKKST